MMLEATKFARQRPGHGKRHRRQLQLARQPGDARRRRERLFVDEASRHRLARSASLRRSVKRAPSGHLPSVYLPLSTPPPMGLYGIRLTFSRRHTLASSSSKRRLSSEKLFWMVS
jgi:hypothetical protein